MSTFNYAARDYDTIKTDLLARADRVMPEWTDRDPSDFGMLLVDLWAMMGDVMHYYADRSATEAFLETATQRESVLAIANLLDYRPVGRTSATGTVSIENTTETDYTLAKDTEFTARHNDTTYVVHAQDTVVVGAYSTDPVIVSEGDLIEDEVLSSSASGLPGQKYSLRDSRAAARTLRVDVYEDGVTATPYEYVARLSQAQAGQRVFSTNVGADSSVEVFFGTNSNGFVPPSGATITATYAASSGFEGNLPAGAVSGFVIAPPSGISVASNTAFSGGIDAESIESMKQSIPSVLSTQDRAVTYNDFVALAQSVPGVSKAALEFTQGSGTADNTATLYVQESRSDYLDTPDTSQTVSTDIRDLVEETVQSKALLGVVVDTAATIDWEPIDVTAEIFVSAKAVTNTVENAVNAALDELFAFDNVRFGQLLHLGQIHRIILNVPGVEYVEVTKFAESSDGPTQVDNSITIDPYELPKKGTYALTFTGGISTS